MGPLAVRHKAVVNAKGSTGVGQNAADRAHPALSSAAIPAALRASDRRGHQGSGIAPVAECFDSQGLGVRVAAKGETGIDRRARRIAGICLEMGGQRPPRVGIAADVVKRAAATGAACRPEPKSGDDRPAADHAAWALSSAGAGRLSKTSSMMPKVLASSASRNLSRSIAFSISSIGWPVYLA